MDLDPFFYKIRTIGEFAKVRATAIACHDDFVADREQAHNMAVSQP